jgi:multidrug efflux pump subunit AcrA (membrane-fusion protein)
VPEVSGGLRKALIAGIIAVAGVGAYFGNRCFLGSDAPEVDVEPIQRRNLEALVSASGTIQPQVSVDISTSVMGRVTQLSVNEGDEVTAGQLFLL